MPGDKECIVPHCLILGEHLQDNVKCFNYIITIICPCVCWQCLGFLLQVYFWQELVLCISVSNNITIFTK